MLPIILTGKRPFLTAARIRSALVKRALAESRNHGDGVDSASTNHFEGQIQTFGCVCVHNLTVLFARCRVRGNIEEGTPDRSRKSMYRPEA